MSNPKVWQSVSVSRRSLLRGAAAGGGVIAALAVSTAQAQNKIAQKTVGYQTMPKGKARCDTCVQFVGPNACKIVQSPIVPAGWCSVYAPKG